MKNAFTFLTLVCLAWTLCSCQAAGGKANQQAKTQSVRQTYGDISYKSHLSEQSAELAKSIKGVDDAVAVVIDKDFSIALKVTGFDRFRLNRIKSEVTKKIKSSTSGDRIVHVTTDKKLFMNLQSLRSKLSEGNESSQKIQKEFKKINDDMHG